ncbi:MAG: hypothetical protein V1809_01935 [Planctomycetota bacterium]
MAEAKGRADWGRTSVVLAVLANTHRDPKKTRAFKPADFNPYATEKKTVGLPATLRNAAQAGKTKDLSVLKAVFVDNHS